MKKKILATILGAALTLTMLCPAFAAEPTSELDSAVAYLRQTGIMIGDENGEMHLEQELDRAELAVLLTRIHGEGEIDPEHYAWACYFTDVPDWAKAYVGYCTANLLVNGYGDMLYGASDPVTPAAACTVFLRACGYASYEGDDWSYNTACSYAERLGWISEDTSRSSAITRAEIALLIYRALNESDRPYTGEVPASAEPGDPEFTDDWDPTNFRISTEQWSREDFSQQANPSVFVGSYTRELYNTFRQTLIDLERQGDADYRYAYTMVGDADYSIAKYLMARMDGVLRYEHYAPTSLANYYEYPDYFSVSAKMPDIYRDAYAFIQPVIAVVNEFDSDGEKVTYLNDYLCSLLTYERTSAAGIPRTFSDHSDELEGACGTYAVNFNFLCSAAGVPCMSISSDNHTWNLVYADGRWLHVDVANNDVSAGNKHNLLLSETSLGYIDENPEMTEFLKELIVPGSTK